MIPAFESSLMYRYIRLNANEYPHDTALSVEYDLRKDLRRLDTMCLVKVDDKDQCIALILWRIHCFYPRTGQLRANDIKDSEEGRRRDRLRSNSDQGPKAGLLLSCLP